jgi:signal peptidase II
MNKFISKISFKNIAIILMIAIFFMTDRYLKSIALLNGEAKSIKLIGNFFSFQFTPNYYMAFSLPFGGHLLNALIVCVISALTYLIFYLIINKKVEEIFIILLTIILFGAISNILDRLVHGYVIDYLYLQYFTVFNIADAMISIGALLIIIKGFKK